MRRILLIAFVTGLLALASAPEATAEPTSSEPQCLQVYPWSKLCEDGAVAFYCGYFQPQGLFSAPCHP